MDAIPPFCQFPITTAVVWPCEIGGMLLLHCHRCCHHPRRRRCCGHSSASQRQHHPSKPEELIFPSEDETDSVKNLPANRAPRLLRAILFLDLIFVQLFFCSVFLPLLGLKSIHFYLTRQDDCSRSYYKYTSNSFGISVTQS